MNEYEAKREARIERLRAAAGRRAEASDAAYVGVRRIADGIPFGQPILVGHHSERRARKDAERIHNGMRKAVDLGKEAADLERRADAAERSTAVSSDDPDAVAKLKQKLAGIEKSRVEARAINAAIRKAKGVRETALANLVALECLNAKAVPAAVLQYAERLLTPDCFGNLGVAPYQLTNWGSEAKRLTKRIAELEAKAARPARAPERCGDIEIDEIDNRVRIEFPGKPDEACRKALKSSGFRWSPTVGRWVRMASEGAWYWARKIVEIENAKAPADPAGSDPLEVDANGELSVDPVGERICCCAEPQLRFSAAELAGELPGQVGKPAGQYCDGCFRPLERSSVEDPAELVFRFENAD